MQNSDTATFPQKEKWNYASTLWYQILIEIKQILQHFFFYLQTNVGPIVLSVNSHRDVGNPLTLTSTEDAASKSPELFKVVDEAVRLQNETGYPQTIIVSGASGSGKSHASMVLLR